MTSSLPRPSLSFRFVDAAGAETGARCRAVRHGRHVRLSLIVVRPARHDDLLQIAQLHVEELPGGLFPRLGPGFLRCWHGEHLTLALGVALVAVTRDGPADRVVGFLTGDLDHAAFVEEVLRTRRHALIARGLLALAMRPRVAASFLRTRAPAYLRRLTGRRPADVVTASSSAAMLPTHPAIAPTTSPPRSPAHLTAIAVRRELRARGVGAQLLEAFHARCGEAGVAAAELLTATASPAPSRFYVRHGWTAVDEEVTRDGVPVRRFRLLLDPSPVRRGCEQASGQ